MPPPDSPPDFETRAAQIRKDNPKPNAWLNKHVKTELSGLGGYDTFIKPLVAVEASHEHITLATPPDSASWTQEHYGERITEAYRKSHKDLKNVVVEIVDGVMEGVV